MANPKDALRDMRNILAVNVYRWKFKALDDSINKLKINFPITDEMLEDVKHLTRERYTTANKAFRMSELKHYEHAHRWVPLMQKMAQEEALVHAIWDYVQDLANTRHHAVFRKSLMDICLEVGVKDMDRMGDHKTQSKTGAQKKMVVQSLVQQKRWTRCDPVGAGGVALPYTPKTNRSVTLSELKNKCDQMSTELKQKDHTIAKLQGHANNTDQLVVERDGAPTTKPHEYELDEDVASFTDSNESNVTIDSGFKSGRGHRNYTEIAEHPEDDMDVEYSPDFEQNRRLLPRPKSARPKSSFARRQEQKDQHKCLECVEHVRKIERQESDISLLTQTIEAHERVFESIQISVEQLLNPSDLGKSDTTNPELLLSDISKTIKHLQNDIDKNVSDTKRADAERTRLQEMVDALLHDKAVLEGQKDQLERHWQESKTVHKRDIEKHRRDIENIKDEMHTMTETHKGALRQIVDEHKTDMSENREQFNSMMAMVMQKLNSSGNDGAHFEPWANVSRSRVQSRAASRGPSRAITQDHIMEGDEEIDCEDEAAVSWESRAMSRRTTRSNSRNLSPDLDTALDVATGANNSPVLGQHSEDSLITIRTRVPSRRRKKRSASGLPDTMRVSPDEKELPPVNPPRVGSQLGRYVEEHTLMLRNRDREAGLTPVNNHGTRENSFTTISDLTRKASRKNMQL